MKSIQFIRHRVNQMEELKVIDPGWGVEIDVRSDLSRPGQLHLSHDPWVKGDDFEAWLRLFKSRSLRGPLVVNTKEDGLEERLTDLLGQSGITNYFFLDTAFPTFKKWTLDKKDPRFALRLSAYETADNFRFFGGDRWVWLDCFDAKPIDAQAISALAGFRLCLVSPELQGGPLESIAQFAPLAPHVQAICTKRPDAWTRYLPQ